MNRSEKIDEIIGMLIKARPALLNIEHDKKGNRGSYISRDRILSAVNTILAPLGGQVIPYNEHRAGAGLILCIMLCHQSSNQYIVTEYTLDEHVDYSQGDPNHKKGGSITYGVRYAIGAMLGISIGDDDYKPNNTTCSEKEYLMLDRHFVSYPELRKRVHAKLGITHWSQTPANKVTDILDWLDEQFDEEGELIAKE